MSVRKDGKKWQARVDMGLNPATGKRMQKAARFDTKHEAELWERTMLSKRGTYCDFTVAEFWDGFYLPYQRERVREATLAHYVTDFNKYAREPLGSLRLDEVKPLHIFTSNEPITPSFVQPKLWTLLFTFVHMIT